jgi:restriction system protein
MDIPKFHETFNPILEILKDGKTYQTRELIRSVKEKYFKDLTDDQLKQETKSGEILIDNRIAWGKSYLKKGGYIEFPERGLVRITEKGHLQSTCLSLNDIQNENSLIDFYSDQTNNNRIPSIDVNELDTASPQDLIDEGFSRIEKSIKADLLNKLKGLDPYFFEKVVLKLLKKMGYGDFVETPKSGDGGIDGVINEDKLGLDKIYIQAKRFSESKVREKDIRNFIGAMSGDTDKGIFVTTSDFDKQAIEKAKNAHHKIILIDGDRLVTLMHDYNVGIQVKDTYEIKQIDEDFFNEE